MPDHACLLASRLYDPFGQGEPHQYITRQAYRSVAGLVTRAWGRVASSCGMSAYHFGAVGACAALLAVIAAGA